MGFIDVLDVVAVARNVFSSSISNSRVSGNNTPDYEKGPHLLHEEKNSDYFDVPLVQLIDFSRLNPVCYVHKFSPLFQTIALLQKGLHRVAILNQLGACENILTQSDVITFMSKICKRSELRDFFSKTLLELGIGAPKKIITVHENMVTTLVLDILISNKISAVPVVDHNGKIVANFSASDLKISLG
eukprot:TRINITY_DN7375_c0_g1_i5.p2 TRINITY_DN7375_c0_g1~~TRINITY_DN7375_c0_g1_i5.p2  ORF type:complete len:187 (-),score=17.57 TRINITY_DN7375_c0_g1_i5:451-1011(-)